MGIVIGMMGIEPTWRVATGIWNRPVFLLQHLPMDVCATIVCDLCVRPLGSLGSLSFLPRPLGSRAFF